MSRRASNLLLGGLFVLSLWAGPEAAAHGDVEVAVRDLSRRLAADPGNAGLLLRRAALHAGHGDYDDAALDLERATALDASWPGLDLAWGRLRLEEGRPAEARRHLDQALDRSPGDAEALVLRARAARQLGDAAAAAADYSAALARLETPAPGLYVERAAAQPDRRAALLGLEEGMARLGPLASLQIRALELEEELGDTAAALARLEVLAGLGVRPETWLKRRGDLLQRAGRPTEAREAYHAALAAVDRLPAALHTGRDMQDLRSALATALAAGP